ncbi:hypothetical protein BJ508DRAFT_64759 [Ascobolus immersus RN42]|uniref:Uncharacterized protein n=1 Tax=Ascobolus immersus RN42 TaxID=1160509 RepID=A0A3N4IQ24_ASCIM|nr:hypothetical protein BJ508DRAFT_64759 [Ascobolus immersus RN42]
MEAYGATRWGMIRYPSNSSLKNAPLAPRITPQDIYFDQEIPDFHLDDVEMNDSAVPSLCSSYSASPSNSFYNTTPPNGAVNKRSSLSSLKFSTSLAQVTSSLASALHLAPPKPQKMVRFSDEVTIIPGGAAEYFEEDEEDFIYGGQETELESQSCQYEKEVEKYAYRPHTPHPHSHASHHHSSRTHPNDAKLAAAREEQRRRGSLSRAPSSPHHNGIWGQYSWEKFPLSPSFDLSGFMKFGSRSSTPAPASSQKSKPVRPRPAPIQTAPMPAYSVCCPACFQR